MGLFQTRDLEEGPMELAHLPNNTPFCWANPDNFSLFHAADQKLFNFTAIQTHRQTHILHPYLHRQDFFLYGNLYLSLHYVALFTLLSHSLCLWRIIVPEVLTEVPISETRWRLEAYWAYRDTRCQWRSGEKDLHRGRHFWDFQEFSDIPLPGQVSKSCNI